MFLFSPEQATYVKPQIDVIKLITMQVNNTIIVLQNGKQNYSLTGRVLGCKISEKSNKQVGKSTYFIFLQLIFALYFELMHFNNNLTYVYFLPTFIQTLRIKPLAGNEIVNRFQYRTQNRVTFSLFTNKLAKIVMTRSLLGAPKQAPKW